MSRTESEIDDEGSEYSELEPNIDSEVEYDVDQDEPEPESQDPATGDPDPSSRM